LIDQVLVSPAQDVRRNALVRQIDLVKVLDEREDHFVGNQLLSTAVRCRLIPVHGKDAAQFVVGGGHGPHSLRQHLPDVFRDA
jgi:hypothetical protein